MSSGQSTYFAILASPDQVGYAWDPNLFVTNNAPPGGPTLGLAFLAGPGLTNIGPFSTSISPADPYGTIAFEVPG
jgi:hypothetical protein